MTILALDLGSRRIGAVAAERTLPLRLARPPATLSVDPADLEPAVDAIAAEMARVPLEAVIVEHGTLYIPAGAVGAKAQAIAANHEVCARLHERVGVLCRDWGVPLVTIARQSWAHRVVPRTSGGITDEMAVVGLAEHVEPESLAALDPPVDGVRHQDQRDACGALVGWILGPPTKVSRKGKRIPRPLLTPEERKAHRRANVTRYNGKRSVRRAEVRAASGCNCGPGGAPRPPGAKGRHRFDCPVSPHYVPQPV